jgi:hypothetical protein
MPQSEIIFSVQESPEGGYEARALGFSIFTQADSLEELKTMIREAVSCHFEDGEKPSVIRLHLVKDEVIPAWSFLAMWAAKTSPALSAASDTKSLVSPEVTSAWLRGSRAPNTMSQFLPTIRLRSGPSPKSWVMSPLTSISYASNWSETSSVDLGPSGKAFDMSAGCRVFATANTLFSRANLTAESG